MAKDPAFLFYPGDWMGGTVTFNRHEKGAYMDLLMAQFNKGRLTIEDIKKILAADFNLWESILKEKFINEDGLFFNKRLDDEAKKRKNFTLSRRNNIHKKDHTNIHTTHRMENENEIILRKQEFKKLVMTFTAFPMQMLNDFFDYWSEHNEGGRKMRFEMQKVFDMNRRLKTWERNQKSFGTFKGKEVKTTSSVIKEYHNDTFVDLEKLKQIAIEDSLKKKTGQGMGSKMKEVLGSLKKDL